MSDPEKDPEPPRIFDSDDFTLGGGEAGDELGPGDIGERTYLVHNAVSDEHAIDVILNAEAEINATKTSVTEQRQHSSSKQQVNNVQINVLGTMSVIVIKSAVGTKRAVCLGFAELWANVDSFTGLVAYMLIAIGYELYKNSDTLIGGILLAVGIFLAALKHQLPEGWFSRTIKKPPDEIKTEIKRKILDAAKSIAE